MAGYIGIGGKAKKIKGIYFGVGGKAKKVKKAYIGVGGKAKLWYAAQLELSYNKKITGVSHRIYGTGTTPSYFIAVKGTNNANIDESDRQIAEAVDSSLTRSTFALPTFSGTTSAYPGFTVVRNIGNKVFAGGSRYLSCTIDDSKTATVNTIDIKLYGRSGGIISNGNYLIAPRYGTTWNTSLTAGTCAVPEGASAYYFRRSTMFGTDVVIMNGNSSNSTGSGDATSRCARYSSSLVITNFTSPHTGYLKGVAANSEYLVSVAGRNASGLKNSDAAYFSKTYTSGTLTESTYDAGTPVGISNPELAVILNDSSINTAMTVDKSLTIKLLAAPSGVSYGDAGGTVDDGSAENWGSTFGDHIISPCNLISGNYFIVFNVS